MAMNQFSINRPSIIYSTLWLVVLGVVGVAYFQTQYIYPSFIEQLVKNTENEAVRVGHHLQKSVLADLEANRFRLSEDAIKELKIVKEDLHLWKVKLFVSDGNTIYSTDENDIGKLNKNSYFHEAVAAGNVFTKSVIKDTKSLEGETITSDVVETYIPIMSQGEFLGAFELYYDITQSRKAMDSLITQNSLFIYTLAGLVILLVFWSMVVFRRSLKERQAYELLLQEEQQILTKSNQKLKNILNELPCAVVLIDKQRKVRWLNEELLRLLKGPKEKEIIGQYCGSFLCPAPESECPLVDTSMKVSNSESYLLTNNKEKIPIIKSIQKVNIDGEDMILESFIDITSRKKLEDELFLARKLESVGQLAAGIAHEINTPAQFIGSNLEFIFDSTRDMLHLVNHFNEILSPAKEDIMQQDKSVTLEKMLKDIDWEFLQEELPAAVSQSQDGIQQISKIVLAMKELSHPGGSEKGPENLNELIDNALTVTSNEWKYDADITLELSPDPPSVSCYRGQISQVFINLIVNAAQAVKEQMQGDGKGSIKIFSEFNDEWAFVAITDSGGGIPEAIQDQIFDPFFTTKEVGQGTGQGLAIAFDVIVTKHAGKLVFETKEGVGTTFTVKLPLG